MSLEVTNLSNTILDIFSNMNNNESFYKDLPSKIAYYLEENCSISTSNVSGTITAGTFTAGVGSTVPTIDTSTAQSIIQTICNTMDSLSSGHDEYLAMQLATALDTMFSSMTIDFELITGTLTTTAGATSVYVGTGLGVFEGVSSTMSTLLATTFTAMDSMASGHDEYLATQLATAIITYLTSGTVTITGTDLLLGAIGTGTIL